VKITTPDDSGTPNLHRLIEEIKAWAAKLHKAAPDRICPYCIQGWIYFMRGRNEEIVNLSRCSGLDSSTNTKLAPVACTCEEAERRGLLAVKTPRRGSPYRERTWIELQREAGFQRVPYNEAFQNYARGRLGVGRPPRRKEHGDNQSLRKTETSG